MGFRPGIRGEPVAEQGRARRSCAKRAKAGGDQQAGKIQLRQDLFVDMNIGQSFSIVIAEDMVRFTSLH